VRDHSDSGKLLKKRLWRVIVENVPLVSVDLVVEHDGGILLGERENEPAKGSGSYLVERY